jgi:hypothetical protein
LYFLAIFLQFFTKKPTKASVEVVATEHKLHRLFHVDGRRGVWMGVSGGLKATDQVQGRDCTERKAGVHFLALKNEIF